jgi:GNAT superfamily N-acetyltransferase
LDAAFGIICVVSTGAIRPASVRDAAAVAVLLGELGHPTTPQDAASRLERAQSTDQDRVVVYELDSQVVGLASYQLFALIYRSRPQCRITALVVRADARRRGIARELVETIESLSRERGCFRIELTTHPDRHEAHRFYAALGFEHRPLRLVKHLDAP